MTVDDLRQQLRDRGYLSHGIERWFALDPWSSRTFWFELLIVAAKGATVIGAFALLPLVAVMLFRNHPLSAWETLAMALVYGAAAWACGFVLLVLAALILRLRPSLAIDTPRALLGISLASSALLSAAIAFWWSQFSAAPSLLELVAGVMLMVVFFLIATLAISAALLSFSIYEVRRVPAIHQRSRGIPMAIAAAVLTALLFIPAYAAQEREAPQAPIQVVTIPTSNRLAFVAVDGLTYEIARSAGRKIAPMAERSTTERWASVGTGVPASLHGVHAVEGVRFRGGRHLLQSLSSADFALRDFATAIGLAEREPLPPTVRKRDFVWENFAERGVTSAAVNWWTTDDVRRGALESIGQSSIFAAARGKPLELDNGAAQRTLAVIDRSRPRFVTVYLPALDVILNRLALDRSTQVADSVRALDGIRSTVDAIRKRGYDVILLGLPGDGQSGEGVLESTIPLPDRNATAYDVAPTLCALLGFPASSEMAGVSLAPTPLPRIATYGDRATQGSIAKVSEEYYRDLKSLGYIR